jgi:hypothetical protein
MRSRLWFLAKPPSCRFRTVSKKMMRCGASSVMPRSWAAVSYIAAAIAEPGVIAHNATMQRLVFGEYDGSRSTRSEAFFDACRRAKIDAELSDPTGDLGEVCFPRWPLGNDGHDASADWADRHKRAPRRFVCESTGRSPTPGSASMPCARSCRSTYRTNCRRPAHLSTTRGTVSSPAPLICFLFSKRSAGFERSSSIS